MTANSSGIYIELADVVLFLHAVFIAWMSFGALLPRSHPLLRRLHIASLIWGILIELFPWTCPLTYFENLLEAKAGVEPYQRSFLLHYLDKIVYPDISPVVLTLAGVLVCAANLSIYARRTLLSARNSKRVERCDMALLFSGHS